MMLHSVSWGAVFAGAVASLITQVILNMLGLGIGLSTVDPMGNGTPEASSLGIGAGLWFVVSGVLAAIAGGFLAGRLSGKPSSLDGRLSRPDRLGRIDPGDPLSPLLGR